MKTIVITQEIWDNLPEDARNSSELQSSGPKYALIDDSSVLIALAGIANMAFGTGNIWMHIYDRTEIYDIWDFIKWVFYTHEHDYIRVQRQIKEDDPKWHAWMVKKFGLTLEATLKKFDDGKDLEIWAKVRK